MNSLDHLFGPQSPTEQLETKAIILMSRFLQLIEQEMDNQGMTRRVLAEKIGTSASYVTQLFRGHRMANMETLAKIELALGVEFYVRLYDATADVGANQEDYERPPKTSLDGRNMSFFSNHFLHLGEELVSHSA